MVSISLTTLFLPFFQLYNRSGGITSDLYVHAVLPGTQQDDWSLQRRMDELLGNCCITWEVIYTISRRFTDTALFRRSWKLSTKELE